MEACKLPLNATFHDLIEEQLKTQQWKGAMIVKGAHGRQQQQPCLGETSLQLLYSRTVSTGHPSVS
jgi:hypothetical protein